MAAADAEGGPMRTVTQIWEALEGTSAWLVLGALLIMLAAVLVMAAVGWLVARAARWFPAAKPSTIRSVVRLMQGAVLLVFVAWALSVLGLGPGWTTVVVLFVVVIGALVAKPVVTNLAAGMRLPFEIDDQIATHGYEGTVVDITASRTVIVTVDQRRVGLPNTDIMTSPLVMFNAAERRRSSLEVGIDEHADLDLVTGLLVEAAAAADGVIEDPAPYVVPTGFSRDAVLLKVKFWHASDLKSAELAHGAAVAAVKGALDQAGVAIKGPEVFLNRE